MNQRPQPPRRAPSRAGAGAVIAWASLHLRRNLRRPGALAAIATMLLAAALLRFVADEPSSASARILLAYPAPLLALFFTSGVLREEVEDGTLTYSFTRPVRRSQLYWARCAAHFGPLLLAVLPAVALVAGSFGQLIYFVLAGAAACLAYGLLFALFGVLSRGAAWIGLAFLIWEHSALRVPGFIQDLSLLTYVHGLAGVSVDAGILTFGLDMPSKPVSLGVLLGVAALSGLLGGQLVERREIPLGR